MRVDARRRRRRIKEREREREERSRIDKAQRETSRWCTSGGRGQQGAFFESSHNTVRTRPTAAELAT
jgi:hypothetical protein